MVDDAKIFHELLVQTWCVGKTLKDLQEGNPIGELIGGKGNQCSTSLKVSDA